MATATAIPPEEPGLFDRKQYDTIPRLDGHTATGLKLGFAGGVELDLYDIEQLEHFRGLLLGDEVTITVHASVSGVAWSHSPDDPDGEKDKKVVNKVTLRVHSYDVESEEVS